MMQEKVKVVNQIRSFFAEFSFSSCNSARFINTLCKTAKTGKFSDFYNYVVAYFKLTYNPYLNEVSEKMKSIEFKNIFQALKNINTSTTINSRFKIYFGDAGTGKTTRAIIENPEATVMLCSSDYESDDLFKSFDFINGSPVYRPSDLRIAMEQGKKVILEEMGLLKLDCMRTLQGILDNKDKFTWKGEEINIAPGFEIIATLNLEVNDKVYELPAPLVDRASELIEFIPTDEFLAKVAFEAKGGEV